MMQKILAKKYLEKVTLFDVYQGEKMQEGYKSFASEFVFQAKDKTLSEKDINKEIDALAKHLEASVGQVSVNKKSYVFHKILSLGTYLWITARMKWVKLATTHGLYLISSLFLLLK